MAYRHLAVEVDRERARQLLAVARRTDPVDVTNLVLQGRGSVAGTQSVVYLDARAAAAVADDVRPDAAIGPARPPLPITTLAPAPATTLAPATSSTSTSPAAVTPPGGDGS